MGGTVSADDLVAKLPPRRRAAIPLADAAALAYPLRRTTLLRLVLAAMLVVACAAAVWRAVELNPRTVAFLPQNSTTVVVIDQSRSIFVGAYRRSAATPGRLAGGPVPRR